MYLTFYLNVVIIIFDVHNNNKINIFINLNLNLNDVILYMYRYIFFLIYIIKYFLNTFIYFVILDFDKSFLILKLFQ